MSHEQDLTVVTDAAWVAFRGRLADRVAAMADDDVLVAEYADAAADEDVVAPYVQLCAFSDEWVRVEAVSNAYLDDSYTLGAEQEELLLELGWEAPDAEDESDNFHLQAERRDADRIAVLLVRTLREVYGIPHPAFLVADGLEADPDEPTPSDPGAHDADVHAEPDDAVAFPHDRDHLQELVDEAMRVVFLDLKHDDDGDIPIIAGQSLAFVRVLADRPGIEVYAEIAIDVEDVDRLALEVGLLNRAHPLWKFVALQDLVVMRHEVMALPFSGHLLRTLVSRFVDEVDAIAGDLVARVGGRRFRDAVPEHDCTEPEALGEYDLAMTGLLELCHLGAPRAATVAGLFHRDRAEVVRQIVAVRSGERDCEGHDVEVVLTALRKALRLLADEGPVPLPPKPRRPDDRAPEDGTLDLGWSA